LARQPSARSSALISTSGRVDRMQPRERRGSLQRLG
jgi:hypothetical protein